MNEQSKWKYYCHAMIPTTLPHEDVDLGSIENRSIWKNENHPWFVRYTTEFDCEKETNWWFVIKDTPIDLSKLKAKRRYEIKSGLKNVDVKRIFPEQDAEILWQCFTKASEQYEGYKQTITKEKFIDNTLRNSKNPYIEYYGAYMRGGGINCICSEPCD